MPGMSVREAMSRNERCNSGSDQTFLNAVSKHPQQLDALSVLNGRIQNYVFAGSLGSLPDKRDGVLERTGISNHSIHYFLTMNTN